MRHSETGGIINISNGLALTRMYALTMLCRGTLNLQGYGIYISTKSLQKWDIYQLHMNRVYIVNHTPTELLYLLRQVDNGIDIIQSEEGIKIYAETYLNKIISTKTFDMSHNHNRPIPMHSDDVHLTTLETTVGPTEIEEQKQLQETVGLKYRNTIGELIFAMVTCRADIAFPIMKLSQYNNRPAPCH